MAKVFRDKITKYNIHRETGEKYKKYANGKHPLKEDIWQFCTG